MKRFRLWAMLFAFVLVVAACGGDDTTETTAGGGGDGDGTATTVTTTGGGDGDGQVSQRDYRFVVVSHGQSSDPFLSAIRKKPWEWLKS